MLQQKNQQKTKPSPEEMLKLRENLMANYKANIEFLKIQVEYEELETRLMEARARQARADSIIAQIYGPKEDESKEAPSSLHKEKISNGPYTDMVQPEEGVPQEPVLRVLKKEKQ